MFRGCFFASVGVLALLGVFGMPGQIYAQHATGGFRNVARPTVGRPTNPGVNRPFFDPRFGRSNTGFNRPFLDPRFGGFNSAFGGFNPAFGGFNFGGFNFGAFSPNFGVPNSVPVPVPVPVPSFP